MPTKTKTDYLNLEIGAGESQMAVILADAVANKGIENKMKSLKYLSSGVVEIVLTNGSTDHSGTGASKVEALADAAGKF
jgi:hypothetical protein